MVGWNYFYFEKVLFRNTLVIMQWDHSGISLSGPEVPATYKGITPYLFRTNLGTFLELIVLIYGKVAKSGFFLFRMPKNEY